MISLERVLDGLEVDVEPLVLRETGRRRPTIRFSRSGCATFELSGGAIVRCSPDRVVVLPPASRAVTGRDDTLETDEIRAAGEIRATFHGSLGLFDHLREPLAEPLSSGDLIRQSIEDIRDEIVAASPGCRAMVETLLRRALVLLLRRHFERAKGRESWLAALQDVRLARALTAMQSRPEEPFSLPQLAQVAGMSRSAFAARFADTLGQSPIEFLKALRLARAAHLLTRTDLPVRTVAAQVGYCSRSSFTRAFLTCHGVGPAAFRARATTPRTVIDIV
jgi:AraC-like DNA-binding protein